MVRLRLITSPPSSSSLSKRHEVAECRRHTFRWTLGMGGALASVFLLWYIHHVHNYIFISIALEGELQQAQTQQQQQQQQQTHRLQQQQQQQQPETPPAAGNNNNHDMPVSPDPKKTTTTGTTMTTTLSKDAQVAVDIAKSLDCVNLSSLPRSQTALHLFCEMTSRVIIASLTSTTATSPLDASLLELWQLAHETHGMSASLIHTVLANAVSQSVQVLGRHNVKAYAPAGDTGMQLVAYEMARDTYGLLKLQPFLGPGKLALDAGSNLGIVVLAILLEYPGTHVISVEAASPTWLLQHINVRTNVPPAQFQKDVTIHLAAFGSREQDGQTLTLIWRPTVTTFTRSWASPDWKQGDDVELHVPLRSLSSILAASGKVSSSSPTSTIDLLKLDCEGCEYNVVPDWTEDEYNAIRYIVGEVHFGFIPRNKRPSTKRSSMTHQRLCRHAYMAGLCKECCAFPTLITLPSNIITVKEIAGPSCDNFDAWSKENGLLDIPDDSGWLSSSTIQKEEQQKKEA